MTTPPFARSASPEDGLLALAMGFQRARVLLTAVELDIFSHLDGGPADPEEVARAIGCDPRATDRLLSALTALGLCRKSGRRYENSEEASALLVPGKPGHMAGLLHANHLYHSWGTLTDAVRRGSGVSAGPVNDRGETWLGAFISAMNWRANRQAPEVAALLELPENGRVLDVGGGSGAYAAAFTARGGNVRAVVFDLPNVVALTRRHLADAEAGERVSVVAGDYLADELPGGFSLVWLSHIIHSNSPDQNRNLFAKCRRALLPGGVLALQDFIMDEARTAPPFGTLFALNMLVNTEHGDTYTRAQVEGWMKEAGLVPEKAEETPSGSCIITGRAPEA